MKPFTVVLKRPDKAYEEWEYSRFDRERDTYVAHVEAEDGLQAITVAKNQVRRRDNVKGIKSRDYITLLVFEGTIDVLYFGIQTGVER